MLQSRIWNRLPLERVSTASRHSLRSLSSATTSVKSKVEGDDDTKNVHPQPFVRAKLTPGEWDLKRTDPYFRPKPSSRFISAEDFANRPPVGFDNEFSSYRDNMIELGWMDERSCREIYEAYINMMIMSQQDHQTTSHEYVVRFLAHRFQLSTIRVAGVIQLQHAEQQMMKNHPELLCEEHAKRAEEAILQNIQDAYRSEGLPPPPKFVEDPTGIHGRGEPDETSSQWSKLDDIFDLEKRLSEANSRDAKRAQILIDNHLYQEDKDDEKEFVKTDAHARRLIKARNLLHAEMEANASNKTAKVTIPYPETNGKGQKRTPWKYVAQIVNTRKLKKKKHELGKRGRSIPTSYTNNTMGNTLVEHNGELRIATIAEAKQTAWKPTRTASNEYLYEGVKKAWIQRTLQGKTEVWGKVERLTRASDSIASATAKEATTPTDNGDIMEKEEKQDVLETQGDDLAGQTAEKSEPVESVDADKSSKKN